MCNSLQSVRESQKYTNCFNAPDKLAAELLFPIKQLFAQKRKPQQF